MHPKDLELLYHLEEKYWWFAGMREITDSIIRPELAKANPRILDAGCGTGFNLGHYLALSGGEVFGVDVAEDAIRWVRRRGFRTLAQASVTELPFHRDTFDVVFS